MCVHKYVSNKCHRRGKKFTLKVDRKSLVRSHCKNSLSKERTRERQTIYYRQNTCWRLFVVKEIILFCTIEIISSGNMLPLYRVLSVPSFDVPGWCHVHKVYSGDSFNCNDNDNDNRLQMASSLSFMQKFQFTIVGEVYSSYCERYVYVYVRKVIEYFLCVLFTYTFWNFIAIIRLTAIIVVILEINLEICITSHST